jgi:hypothetical protein
MKALCISIKNAGLWKYPMWSKDCVYDSNGKTIRKKFPYYEVPIGHLGVQQVANLLRVLCGQRPVPSLRKCNYTGDPLYEELAKKSRANIHSIYNDKGYIEEVVYTHKSNQFPQQTAKRNYILDNHNIGVIGGLIYWRRLRRIINDNSLFQEIITTIQNLSKVNNVQESFHAQTAIEFLNKHKTKPIVIELCKNLKKNHHTSLSNIILNEHIDAISIHQGYHGINSYLSCGSVEKIQRLDASLYVPVTNEQLKLFSNGTGAASFLEGGFVAIESIEEWSPLIEIQSKPVVEGVLIKCT